MADIRDDVDEVGTIMSQTLVKMSGIKSKYGCPTVNPPEMNAEIDELFFEKKAELEQLIKEKQVEAKRELINELLEAKQPLEMFEGRDMYQTEVVDVDDIHMAEGRIAELEGE